MDEKKRFLIIHWIFLCQFVDNFSELLFWEINVLDIFNIVDFYQIFVISRSTEILTEFNIWFEM